MKKKGTRMGEAYGEKGVHATVCMCTCVSMHT